MARGWPRRRRLWRELGFVWNATWDPTLKRKVGADGKRKACAEGGQGNICSPLEPAHVTQAPVARVLSVDPARPQASVLEEALRVLLEGGLVAFPTETVYGLGARALDETAVRRVFAAKVRPTQHPLIAHVQ